ncbi:hypothetical protein [Streptomyces sp. SCSIO ZS0520]|uniref:hypothetical protein n=1 Tax=Streptomyces sp. SCSIO ZS0520 TaxID=2892996 RepID=UPI0021DA7156|nr:hypothetical protein [Streptomyces sp. SCSIO ZS0520]
MSARIIGGVSFDLDDAAFWTYELTEGGTTVVHIGDLALHIGPATPAEGLRALAAELVRLAEARETGGAS